MGVMNPSSQEFFDAKYQQSPDPWNFAASEYELNRYTSILGALNLRRYQYAFEPGCSIGVLTESLAGFCDQVDAVDISPTAAALARERCVDLSNVTVRCASLDEYIPASLDLLVFSEIGYYFSFSDLRAVLTRCISNLRPGGTLLATHWLGKSPDHILGGNDVHETIAAIPGLILEYSDHRESFRLDRWRKVTEASL
jgi:SAM-dependent methyltransferase